jgi:hypothetical protein
MNLTRLRVVSAASLLLVAACYVQQPLNTNNPVPETRVIAQVTDTGSIVMSNTIGPAAVEVEGVVVSTDANAWNLRLLRVHHRGGTAVGWNREVVSFPRFAFSNVAERRLDQTRSWMAGGLLAAGAFVMARAFGLASGDDMPDRIGPAPPAN